MKINSINTINKTSALKQPSFKHTAVPYPEYKDAYDIKQYDLQDRISNIVTKIADLFHPEVTKEAKVIKSQIDDIYDKKPAKAAKQQLLSVLA